MFKQVIQNSRLVAVFVYVLSFAIGMMVWMGVKTNPIAYAAGSNNAPSLGTAKVLYDGALGGTPDNQSFLYLAIPSAGASNSATGGVTTLDTTLTSNNTQAGYSGNPAIVPVLDRNTGYTVRFVAQIVNETHAGSDKNGDGLDDRAGFSMITISSDGQYGIELGFWTNRIWAQNDGGALPPAGTLFTQGEGAAFNTTLGLIPYELRVLDNAYSLVVSNTEILSGSLRDYSAFTGPIDPYESPSYIFFGDDTTSAGARVKLSYVSVITNATLPDRPIYLPIVMKNK
jgi:hypothetical protein